MSRRQKAPNYFPFLPRDVSEAILGDLGEEARCRRNGRLWIYWQLARSVWPLLARAAERAGVSNVALWFVAGYFVFALPLFAIGSIRDFVLTQVPLRTGADPGPMWMVLLLTLNAAGLAFGSWLALRRMGPQKEPGPQTAQKEPGPQKAQKEPGPQKAQKEPGPQKAQNQ